MWNAFNPIQWLSSNFVFVTFRIVLMNECKLKIRLIKKQHHYDNILHFQHLKLTYSQTQLPIHYSSTQHFLPSHLLFHWW